MPHATAVRTGPEPNRQVESRVVDEYARRWIHPRLTELCLTPPRTVATSATSVHNSLPPPIRTSIINTPHPPFERQPPDKVSCGDIACENVMHRGCELNSTARHANQFHGCSAPVVLFLFARLHVECRRIMRASIGSFTSWYLCGRLFDRRSIAGTPISQPKTVRSSTADVVEFSSGLLE